MEHQGEIKRYTKVKPKASIMLVLMCKISARVSGEYVKVSRFLIQHNFETLFLD